MVPSTPQKPVVFSCRIQVVVIPPLELLEELELDEEDEELLLEEDELLELEELLEEELLELLEDELELELLEEELELEPPLLPAGSPNTIPRPAVLIYTRPYTLRSPTTNSPLPGPPNSWALSLTRTQV